ncbi:hypothetical protein [Evansella cellulosilytica]|uniref:Uncharacterized protein n=1 Tax=Evansella cellulosilytica (strain ATCC 21833 / DSM 2522 / FERM P-1141 / JCM 9156 / N-4) TaxID=649639 RepID=E6TWH4_EVAC2|nr:hypothetical protein [Evansella cellulosilytica]ADU32237.1 hypothetical protein Bcell_4006 [Evansella cellulosilytica DSM 2522]
MDLLERVITAIVSALLFSFALSALGGLMEYFLAYFIFSFFIIAVGGIIFSIFADLLLGKMNFNRKLSKYFMSIVLYAAGGIVVNVFFYITVFNEGLGEEALQMMTFGIVAALIFLHIKYLTSLVTKKFVY